MSGSPTFVRLFRILSLMPAFAMGGCFHPLYGGVGDGAGGKSVTSELQAIVVDPIPERIGHYLGNELIFRLNGTGGETAPKYHLVVTANESIQTALVDSTRGSATSGTLNVTIGYQLLPATGGAAVTSGDATGSATYDRSPQRFANVRAARDAEVRVAQTLADLLKTRLAAYFATHP